MSTLTAPELFALSHYRKCEGEKECHWCGAKCKPLVQHDDLPRWEGVRRSEEPSKRPSSPWICAGCWLWRRRRITIFFPDKSFKDGGCPVEHSWLVTEEKHVALRETDGRPLWEVLLAPPKRFFLSFLREGKKNYIQSCVVNDFSEVRNDSVLYFTLDNKPYPYTTYELREALRSGEGGKEPGARLLLKLLGPYQLPPEEMPVEGPRSAGRPVVREHEKPSVMRKAVSAKK